MFKKLSIFALILMTSGCITTQGSRSGDSEARAKMPVRIGSILFYGENVYRNGDRINFWLEGERYQRRMIQIDCAKSQMRNMYIIDGPFRIYTAADGKESFDLYVPPGDNWGLADEISFISRPKLLQLCTDVEKPTWATLRVKEDEWVQIDPKSIKPINENSYRFRAQFDYAKISFDPPFNAPYASKQEDLVVKCNEKKITTSSGVDVDEEGNVTDGMFGMKNNWIDWNANDDYQLLAETVCSSKGKTENLKAIPTPTRKPRIIDKTTLIVSDIEDLKAFSPEVLKAAEELQAKIGSLRKSFTVTTRYSYSLLSSYQSVFNYRPVKGDFGFSLLEGGNTSGKGYYYRQLFIGGLVRLAGQSGDSPRINRLTKLTVQGDFSPGQSVEIAAIFSNDREIISCQISRDSVLASSIIQNFAGNAYPMNCIKYTPKSDEPFKAYWFTDYGWVYSERSKTTIESVDFK